MGGHSNRHHEIVKLVRDKISRKIPITDEIPILINLLDEYQDDMYIQSAKEVSEILIQIGPVMIPFLNLEKKDISFLNFFAYYFIPECDINLLNELYCELKKVILRNDYTEMTDLSITESLLRRSLHSGELLKILRNKEQQAMDLYAQTRYFFYLEYAEYAKKIMN